MAKSQTGRKVRIGIMADIHHDIMHDAPARLTAFMERMNREKVDFIIQLGDFCFPLEENRDFRKLYDQFAGPRFHVLGNHDMDRSDKQQAVDFLGMSGNYYSFDLADIHCVVLDTNYFMRDGRYMDYAYANYFTELRAFIPDDQFAWLKSDLEATDRRTVLFSHQSLLPKEGGCLNGERLHNLFKSINERSGYRKIIGSFNGDTHLDGAVAKDGIHYIEVNSISYKWLGREHPCLDRYDRSIMDKHENIRYVVPYRDPLYMIVTLDDETLTIEGRRSVFVGPGPDQLGYTSTADSFPVTPVISDRILQI